MILRINHNMIKNIIRIVGLSIFVLSIAYQLKRLFIYGGKQVTDIEDDAETEISKDTITSYDIKHGKISELQKNKGIE